MLWEKKTIEGKKGNEEIKGMKGMYYTIDMMQRPYEKLIVWKAADELCLFTYEMTKKFPSEEKFGLVTQMRRCSYGVPMCIVEGNARRTEKDTSHFFVIALSSLEELHYQYSLA